MAFPFDDDFSVGTIHGANAAKQPTPNAGAVVEIQDDEDNVSVLPTKTGADIQLEVVVGCQAPPGSNPVVGPTAAAIQTVTTSGGSSDPTSAGLAEVKLSGGRLDNSCHQTPFYICNEGERTRAKWIVQ